MPLRRLLLLAIFLWPLSATAVEWVGTVVGIADGDTLTLLDARQDDTPHPHRWHRRAQSAPSRTASARASRSRISRTAAVRAPNARSRTAMVARCAACSWTASMSASSRCVADCAWHYVKYAHEQSPQARLDYARAEEQARIARSGLWTVAAPTPPWDYRREQAARAEGR